MGYRIVEKAIGRAGNKAQMERKQIDWDRKYGKGKWITGYEVNGQFMTRDEAVEKVYDAAYFAYLDNRKAVVNMLVDYDGCFNPHARFTNSTDIQAQTIDRYLKARGLKFNCGRGFEVAIGTWQPRDIARYESKIKALGYTIYNGKIQYEALSQMLSPFNIKTLHDPSLSVEDFWQSSAKCLAVIE